MASLIHHATCTADYPEKIAGEAPQQLMVETLPADEGGGVLTQCVDCGAFTLEGNTLTEEEAFAEGWDRG